MDDRVRLDIDGPLATTTTAAPGTHDVFTFGAWPDARSISGHTPVVDGADRQRRSLTDPGVVPVCDRRGLAPFAPDGASMRR